ncbi:MAG: alanine dehydrogenase [Candidatus Aenigmarchaeota archaeon]|nr:alanine dehydrogenase [Candidatus Aenigmarchaeota archaeon]
MKIGTVKEIKTGENRVGLTPLGTASLAVAKHEVFVEKGAGAGSGFSDEEYKRAGAKILMTAKEVWNKCDMVVKVKEPVISEFPLLREGLILFTYFHLASDKKLTEELMKKKVTAVAYETVELEDKSTPLLTPMSEVAGRMSVLVGVHYLQKHHGGSGVLLSGVPGVAPGKVAIVGTGVVGINAAKMAYGLGADVTIVGRNPTQLKYIDDLFHGKVKTLYSNPANIERAVSEADLLVGAVYNTGASAPKLVTRDMVRKMRKGSVIVDVSIDQGGCIETIRATTHEQPVYVEEGVIHYGVTNMPGAVARTSTLALTSATLPYALALANKGVVRAVKEDPALWKGVNTHKGKLTEKNVSSSLKIPYTPLEQALK